MANVAKFCQAGPVKHEGTGPTRTPDDSAHGIGGLELSEGEEDRCSKKRVDPNASTPPIPKPVRPNADDKPTVVVDKKG